MDIGTVAGIGGLVIAGGSVIFSFYRSVKITEIMTTKLENETKHLNDEINELKKIVYRLDGVCQERHENGKLIL